MKSGTYATARMRSPRTEYQLMTLIRLGLQPGSGAFREVQLSMIRVLEARKRNKPERVLASLTLF